MNVRDKLTQLARQGFGVNHPLQGVSDGDCPFPLPGMLVHNAGGSYWQVKTELGLTHRHGNFLLGNFLRRKLEYLKFTARQPLAEKIAPQKILFMDTETTGLAGGTGTMAFLVGVGYFEQESFVIEQYFVRRFADERAVLGQFAERLEETIRSGGVLITFNGKCFDLPLLRNRAVLQRLAPLPPVDAHIDLLYPSRRLWKKHLPDCALKTLERELAGVIREGDVPAWLIPELYFRYLRSSDPTPLKGVFYHNRLDILSMVALLDLLLLLFSDEREGVSLPVDRISMARMAEEVERESISPAFYDRLLKGCSDNAERMRLLVGKARLYKRRKNYAAAVKLWQEAIDGGGFCVEPYEELAKIYEHRLSDPHQALAYTQCALEKVALLQRACPERVPPSLKANFLQRLRRLRQKQQREIMCRTQKKTDYPPTSPF